MKKFFILWVLILSLFFAFACSSDEEKEELDQGDTGKTDTASTSNDSDKTDTADSANDAGDSADSVETDSSDSGSSPDTGASDTEADSTDSADNTDSTGDSDTPQPDNDSGNTEPADDSGDSAADSDTGTAPDDDGQLPELPECDTPSCTDSENSLIWSGKTTATYNWSDSKSYCENQGGGWRLPTIDELRTLVLNCAETATNGACNVKEGCLKDSSPCYVTANCMSKNCPTRNDGSYSRLGDTDYLWSSSETDGDASRAWYLNFKFAAIGSSEKKDKERAYTRCVKKSE